MVVSLVLLVIFAIVVAAVWLRGLWTAALALINVLLSALLATNFFEPVAALLVEQAPGMAKFADFVSLWGLFAVSLGVLGAITYFVQGEGVKFIKPVELIGRSILALMVGWIVLAFAAMTLHTAPLAASPMGAFESPNDGIFFGMAPDRQWLSFVRGRSRGALSASDPSASPGAEGDQGLRVFDPQEQFTVKYYHRRKGS